MDEVDGMEESPSHVETHDNNAQEANEYDKGEQTSSSSVCCAAVFQCMRRFRQKWPRTFHLLVRVVIPLLGLIAVSFFCGYFLARMESTVEKETNDAKLASAFNFTLSLSSIAYGKYIPAPCLADWNVNDPQFNATGLRDFLDDCQQDLVRRKKLDEEEGDLSFDWIKCVGKNTPYIDQYQHVLYEWTDDFYRLASMYATEYNMTAQKASDTAMDEATGHQDCKINTSAGALFWFTIMTTIGYGNTAPSSTGGRAMIYTIGFLSIILFGTVIGWAAHICIVVFEDFCLRCNLKFLTKGILAPLFWLSVLVLWLLVLAGITLAARGITSAGDGLTLSDAYWFMYITITTVGLGDVHYSHETFMAIDMFVGSFLVLLGFVLMANFIFKLVEWLKEVIPGDGQPLEDILEESRNSVRSSS